MVSGNSSDTVERRIIFFRVDIGTDPGGIPVPFDPQPMLQFMTGLPFSSGPHGRYWEDSDDSVLCLLDGSSGPLPTVQFCRVRRAGLPQLERAGNVKDLDIAPDEGLLETTHAVFFPKNVVGVAYNHYGPRLSLLGNYIHRKSSGNFPKARFNPILRDDPTLQLGRLTDVRLFDIGIRRPYVDFVRQAAPSLADALDANARLYGEPEKIQVVLRYPRERSSIAWRALRPSVADLVVSNAQAPVLDRLRVRGHCEDTDRVEPLDLLKDNIITTKQIVRLGGRGRAVDPVSAYDAISESYGQLSDDIAASVDASI